MQFYKLNKIGECKIKTADFQILPDQVQIFSQIRTLQISAKDQKASPVNRKSEKYDFFRKQNWFGDLHPIVQLDAKTDYVVSKVLLEMDHTCLSIYKKLCNLNRDLKQTALIPLTQQLPLIGYVITGKRHTFATLKSSNVISLFQCKVFSSPLFVLENQCFERIPIF